MRIISPIVSFDCYRVGKKGERMTRPRGDVEFALYLRRLKSSRDYATESLSPDSSNEHG